MNLDKAMKRYSYPSTLHLPFSGSVSREDKVINPEDYNLTDVVLTEKRDGGHISLYVDGYVHARSIDGTNHEWMNWCKNLWSKVFYKMPHGSRLCGENLYAKHSIGYDNLDSYLEIYSMWYGDICLDWEETQHWVVDVLGLNLVPVIAEGNLSLAGLEYFFNNIDTEVCEGLVVRNRNSFMLHEFNQNVFKAVRPNHVQTDVHWTRTWEPNKLAER